MSKRLKAESRDVFIEYDKNGDGSLDLHEIETLLADLIEVEKKNVNLTVDLDQDAAMKTCLRLLRSTAREEYMGSGLSAAEIEQHVKEDEIANWPKQEYFNTQKSRLLVRRRDALNHMWGEKDAQKMVRLMKKVNRNGDGKVDQDEFVDRYCEALVALCSPACSLRPLKLGVRAENMGRILKEAS